MDERMISPNQVREGFGWKPIRYKAPQCPYCGDITNDRESRVDWMNQHLHKRRHRWWWKLKKVFKRGK